MAVKRYDGSQWVTVAGKGDQGTSSSIATWVKTATGGETSVSGNDDNSQPLSYTVGQELVFINGALQKRGADYTATTGNSITGLTALAANDVVTVWTVNAFSVTNAISNTLVDAKGDLIVATGADTPGRLAVGSTNQVLTVDSSTGTGLKWATPAADFVKVTSGTFSNQSSVTIDSCFTSTYQDYMVILEAKSHTGSGSDDLQLQFRYGSTTETGNNYFGSLTQQDRGNVVTNGGFVSAGQATLSLNIGQTDYESKLTLYFKNVGNSSQQPAYWGTGFISADEQAFGIMSGMWAGSPQTYTGFLLKSSSSNITGSYAVWGLKQ